MEVPEETSSAISGTSLPQSGEIVLAKFEALTSRGNDSGSQISEQIEEQVLGYLEVQPSEVQLVQDSNTIYLQPQEIEIDGEHLILAQGEEAGEIIVVVSTDQEHSADQTVAELAQGAVVNATVMHSESGENKARMFVVNQSNAQFDVDDKKTVTSPASKSEVGQLPKSLATEQAIISPQNDKTITDNEIVQNTENIIHPEISKNPSDIKEKDILSQHSIPSQELKDRKLMQLACIAHEMQIENNLVMKQTDSNTTTTEIPRKTCSDETEHKVGDGVSSKEHDGVDESTGDSSAISFLQDQSTSMKVKDLISESSVNEIPSQKQMVESEERSRRSMEAAETIAALQHSDRVPLDELNQLSQNDQSVPNNTSCLTLLENSSLAVPDKQVECNPISLDTIDFSHNANKIKNTESGHEADESGNNKSETEKETLETNSTQEMKNLEVQKSKLEKENIAISHSYINIPAEESSNSVKEQHCNTMLESNIIEVKICEKPTRESPEETENDKEGFQFESCKETMLETFNKQVDFNLSSLSQIHSFSLETSLTKSTSSNVMQTLESFNKTDEGNSDIKKVQEDINIGITHKNDLVESCAEISNSDLPLIKECTSKLPVDDDCKDMDETTNCISDLNNSKINASKLSIMERAKTMEQSSLNEKFSQDVSSSQAVSTDIDNSFDQVVPQIDIASGTGEKNTGTSGICQGTNDSLFTNKQEEFKNSSNIQNTTNLKDLHNKEEQNFEQKLVGRSHCLSSDIPCVQKDESHCDSQIKHKIQPLVTNINASEIRTVTKIGDKTYNTVSSVIKGFTEERKKIGQTVDCIQKQSFMQSSVRPLRPKQPVVIHLRSSIAKPSIDDLNKGESSNKSLLCDVKESKENNETLEKPVLLETEENCSKMQSSIVNDKESVSTVSTIHENIDIVKESSSIDINSFIDMQSMGSSDQSSMGSETSHSSIEIFGVQSDVEKDSTENEIKKALEGRTECLTPKIKKQFQLIISPEKSDAEVSFTSIKSKIHQKLQFDSDANDSVKDVMVDEEEPVPQSANNGQDSQIEQISVDMKKKECESIFQPEHENEKSKNTSKNRGFKRKSPSSSKLVNKIPKVNTAENVDPSIEEQQKIPKVNTAENVDSSVEEQQKIPKVDTAENVDSSVEEQQIEEICLKKVGKRKATSESEPLLKHPRVNLENQTENKDELSKTKKSSPLQKMWFLRSHSTSLKEVKDSKSKLDTTSTNDQSIKLHPVAETSSTEISVETIIDKSVETEKAHPVSEKLKSELSSLPSVPVLESLAEDSDHSGISEDHISRPPVLITRNKFLNSSNSVSPKNKRQYIKKHMKSKSLSLSVQKAQSPRKYSPKAAKSLMLPSTLSARKKHLRTKSEPIMPTNSEREVVATPVKICDFRIRCQQTPTTPTEKVGNYSCVGCCFRTSRVQNLIHHYREKCLYTGPDAFHWDVDQIEGAKREDSQKTFKANGCSTTKHIIDTGKNLVGSSASIPTKKLLIKSGDKMEETIDSDSNSDDLPPAFDTPSKKKFGFAEDDVVWVEWKTLHWPALVRKIYMKPKKASIMFIDSPSIKKGIRVSIKKISTFNNAERNKKYLSEGRAVSLHSDTLVKAVQKAEDFLRKRCLGISISAAQFFGSLDDFPECMSDKGSSTGTPSESGDIARERHLSEVSSTRSFSPVLRINEESVKHDVVTEENNEVADPEALARRKERRKNQNAKLLQCIKDGKVETHLLGVYRNTISSERHKLFHSNIASERNRLKQVSWFGPIDDEEQQEEIYDYCFQLFKSACQYNETFDLVAYMFEVWVPEAVVRAISRVRRLSMSQAEDTFAKGVIWSKAEKEEARKEIVNFTFTEEDRREHREKVADSLRIAGVQENIIQALDL